VPVPPVAHLRFGHDAAARRGESHAFRVELLSDPKGGVALPGYFLGVVTEHVVLTTQQRGVVRLLPRPDVDGTKDPAAPLRVRVPLVAHPRAEASIWTR
jgi:hypothetical protein